MPMPMPMPMPMRMRMPMWTCTLGCQSQWANEQDCADQASFVIECVDANQSCTTLEGATCGDVPSAALRMLLDCIDGD